MNLAILIGVSEYKNSNDNLPACGNDLSIMEFILGSSGKFADILTINDDTTSANIKSKLSEYVTAHKSDDVKIEELFFYYTGHGELDGEDFLFLPSDFDEKKKKQTGLANSELDAMLRALNPSLTIKIVDACHSGVSYIKKSESIKKALNFSKGEFSKCYFMFSSQKQEPSFQDDKLSDFTKAFVMALHDHKGAVIRYKDVIDYIYDAFESEGDQTPTFVIQADLVEVFCTVTSSMREAIARIEGVDSAEPSSSNSTDKGTSAFDLVRTVKEEARRYCTKEEVMDVLSRLSLMAHDRQHAKEVVELYKCEVVQLDKMDIPNETSIAKWLKNNPNDYFVSFTYKDEKYQEYETVPKASPFGISGFSVASMYMAGTERRKVTRTRQVIGGFKHSTKTPYVGIKVDARPLYENLNWWSSFIIPVFSKVSLRLFYCFVASKESNWGEWIMPGNVAWQTNEIELKGAGLEPAVEAILKGFDAAILTPLVEKYKSIDQISSNEEAGTDKKEGDRSSQNSLN